MRNIFLLLRHDLLAGWRHAFSWLTPLLFFVMVVSLFPLALGTNPELLTAAAPAIIWVAAMLAVLLSIGTLFRDDAHAGFLDLLILSPRSLTLLVLCKITSHWLTHCLPLVIISPLLGLLLNLNGQQESVLVITLLLGTPVLSLLGGIGAALVVGIRQQGLLLPILIMPLYIPVLIFGTGALTAASTGLAINAYVAILAALFLISLVFAPFITGVALRIGVNN
jgi:heme exporter protein B